MKNPKFNTNECTCKKISIIEWLLKIQDEALLDKIGILVASRVDKWDTLSEEQQLELSEAMEEIDSGKGIAHEKVMAKFRKR